MENKTKWNNVKKFIMALPANLEPFITETMKKNPEMVKFKVRGADRGWYINQRIEGYEVDIIVERYQNRKDRILGIAWDNKNSVAFVRDFLDLDSNFTSLPA